MARSLKPFTWQNGFKEPLAVAPWEIDEKHVDERSRGSHYDMPPSKEQLTSTVHNSLGLNVMRTWPTLYDGTNAPHGVHSWWKPSSEVDVLICGAGPFGLEVALSLVRQGVAFRIVDKAEGPLLAGRADGVQPRFLELLNSWGLAQEVHEEGPIIDRTVVYKDGKQLFNDKSHQSDSRYRGLHIITQGQLERIYVRDLMRHQVLIERSTVIDSFETLDDAATHYPVQAFVRNEKTGSKESIRAKFIVGADGAGSSIRKQLQTPFDGVSTDIYWAILDAQFETDFPYITMFGAIINSQHDGCIIVPREDGFVRLYTQIDAKRAKELAESHGHISSIRANGRINDHSLTAEEVLEQTNRIFSPFTLKFSSPISWFAVWRISERVARIFSSPDLRVHLGGDAAHVHSVMGAFGLNASIMDASNLAWKIGLIARSRARLGSLAPTYDRERRLFAQRIIKVSGSYLRFVCNSHLPLANLEETQGGGKSTYKEPPPPDGTPEGDLGFLGAFFGAQDKFLLGLDAPYEESVINPGGDVERVVSVKNGVRAPNPRVCFGVGSTGYLYDQMTGASVFHIIVFGSDIQGPVREGLVSFSTALGIDGFYTRFGGREMFNVVLVTKCLPFEAKELLSGDDLAHLRQHATVVYDDRAPDEDAHYWYGVNHAKGAMVVVRPDLWVGMSTSPRNVHDLDRYFEGFLIPVQTQHGIKENHEELKGANSIKEAGDLHRRPNGLDSMNGVKEISVSA